MLKDPFDVSRALVVLFFSAFALFAFLFERGVSVELQPAQVSQIKSQVKQIAGPCYVGVTLNESKNGGSSSFTYKSTAITSADASPLVNRYYAEEPSPFYASVLNGSKTSLGKYELWSGRYI